MSDYSFFFNADLTKLPDAVLTSIETAVRNERFKRRKITSIKIRQDMALTHELEKRFVGLPNPHHEYNHRWLRYLDGLLDQDWSHLFSGDDTPKYYVYVHYAPNNKAVRYVGEKAVLRLSGLPFYVGKGVGDRAFDLKRNQGHGATIKELLLRHKPNDIVSIIKDGLTEAQALELESKLIYFFGTRYESGRRGLLVNLDIPKRPELRPSPRR